VQTETNARRLFSVTRRHVANIAFGKHADGLVTRHRMIDVAGLFASRAARLPPTSEVYDRDLLRDIRVGLHLVAMQELIAEVSEGLRLTVEPVFRAVAPLYDGLPAERGASLENALRALDDLILSTTATTDMDIELLLQAVALRLCIAPEVDRPVPGIPFSERNAA
jgi:uncharacterized membrane protein YccC